MAIYNGEANFHKQAIRRFAATGGTVIGGGCDCQILGTITVAPSSYFHNY